jgi:hypothetical protein
MLVAVRVDGSMRLRIFPESRARGSSAAPVARTCEQSYTNGGATEQSCATDDGQYNAGRVPGRQVSYLRGGSCSERFIKAVVLSAASLLTDSRHTPRNTVQSGHSHLPVAPQGWSLLRKESYGRQRRWPCLSSDSELHLYALAIYT